jgi:hypothetical protein
MDNTLIGTLISLMASPQGSAMIVIKGARLVSATVQRAVFSAIQDINCSQTSHAQNVKRLKAFSLMKRLNAKRYVEMAYCSILHVMMATKRVEMDAVHLVKLSMVMHVQLQTPPVTISYLLLSRKFKSTPRT